MPRACLLLSAVLLIALGSTSGDEPAAVLHVGFGEADITPKLGAKPVYLAGFGHNRKAAGVHDPLRARALDLQSGRDRVALVSLDLVGLFHPQVERVRARLPGFRHVLVSSTHNHEGPDSLGLWGPSPFQCGADPDYLALVEDRIVQAVKAADADLRPATARIGTARDAALLRDNREPEVKHDELVALRFEKAGPGAGEPAGLVVQWNCHPETLDSRNTQISADFVAATVAHLREKYRCPVVYLTGTVGGLMTSLGLPVRDDEGRELADGTFAKTERYGQMVGRLAERALAGAKPLRLTPFDVRAQQLYLPVDNKLYRLAWQLGVLRREVYLWKGDVNRAEPAGRDVGDQPLCLRTELACLRLGELEVAAVPGEIYPELVLDRVQDPADPGADFPDAPVEPAIYRQMRGPHRMLVGLANDEVGYIIPRRQWDEKAPFCYGRKKSQYGEMNSLGPQTAPLLCEAFRKLAR